MIGQTISHYRIIEKIGDGGMGEVYLAVDVESERKVAIKFLYPDKAADPESRARFKHEAKAHGMLSHPNIATFLEVGEVGGKIFIVMEYVEGLPLTRLSQGRVLTFQEVLGIALQMAEGLQAAHKLGVMHRDVKPENILVTPENVVKITDFGLAKWKGATTITKSGTRMGTPRYMSPEQSRSERVDQRSDLFSFGAILYEMITSHPAFRGEHEAAIAYSICYEEPEPLLRYKADVPDELQRIVSKALEKDKNLRYQSADHLIADLKGLQKEIAGGLPRRLTRRIKRKKRLLGSIAALVAVAAFVILYRFFIPPPEPEGHKVTLAVLPFENLGAPEQEYFADGVTDQITTNLAKLSGLDVISRTSATRYKNSPKRLTQIGKELGADFILEGTCQVDHSGSTRRVKINPQLIKVKDDSHLWAQTFELAHNQIFEIQSTIAEKVALALNITLLDPEQTYLKTKPTESIEAYEYYLKGNRFFDRRSADIGTMAEQQSVRMYEKAVELDSGFTFAFALLGRACAWQATLYTRKTIRESTFTSEQWQKQAQRAIHKALVLNPNFPEGHLSLGYYHYWVVNDIERALQEFELARKGLPNNSELLAALGQVQKIRGKGKEAAANFKKAVKLDPLSAENALEAGLTFDWLRQYPEAERFYNRAISLAPEWQEPYAKKAFLYIKRQGNVKKAREVLQEISKNPSRAQLLITLIEMDILERNHQKALERISDTLYKDNPRQRFTYKARIYGLMKQGRLAQTYYDSLRKWSEPWVDVSPKSIFYRRYLGLAYAGLGRKEEAIRAGKRAVELLPVSKDAVKGADLLKNLAEIYTMVGEPELAIDELEYLLSIPSEISVPYLRIDPTWNSLRSHPRFQKLLAKK